VKNQARLPMGCTVTREQLDRLCIVSSSETITLSCSDHPSAGASISYSAGHLRLLCRSCGYEIIRVKVALVPMAGGESSRLEALLELFEDKATAHLVRADDATDPEIQACAETAALAYRAAIEDVRQLLPEGGQR